MTRAPYSYRTTLESKTTSYGGYGYGFTGPNPLLKPEFAKSYEFGTELSFLNDRLGIDATVYRKRTENQIVQNLRESYATGFILFNLNGATTENKGVGDHASAARRCSARACCRGTCSANFTRARGKTLSLPNALPESYVSDTWLYGNVRNGTEPGLSTMSLTGLFYLRNNKGNILIDPTTGLPLRSTHVHRRAATIVSRTSRSASRTTSGTSAPALSFLFDIRKGGDVFNATEHYLTIRGLATSTLDRNTPRVITGVLRDGKENTATPTPNTSSSIPAMQTAYYTSMSEELFIEKNINWLRLRDVTFTLRRCREPLRAQRQRVRHGHGRLPVDQLHGSRSDRERQRPRRRAAPAASASTTANFPIPRGINFGFDWASDHATRFRSHRSLTSR